MPGGVHAPGRARNRGIVRITDQGDRLTVIPAYAGSVCKTDGVPDNAGIHEFRALAGQR